MVATESILLDSRRVYLYYDIEPFRARSDPDFEFKSPRQGGQKAAKTAYPTMSPTMPETGAAGCT